MKRISMNFNEELLAKIDKYAKDMNITRTSAVAVICNMYFQGLETKDTLKSAIEAIEKAGVYNG
jgi:metal-responsive CopG/Arc/MetJ family transcriptional regulator